MSKLKTFHNVSKLKKVALTAIAKNLQPKQIEELTTTFKALDVNGDGTLSYEEIANVMQKEEIDSDGDGSIDYTEFIAATMEKSKYMTRENLWISFRQFDLDGDGKITKEELKQ